VSRRRALRVALSAAVGLVVLVVLLIGFTALALRVHPRAAAGWIEFSIGPATGESASIGTSQMRADGITVKAAIATACDVPPVRVFGPPWLSRTRYAITAVAPDAASFRPMLRQELQNRLRLETHVEPRTFDVFVLRTHGDLRLLEASRPGPSTWLEPRTARLRDASSERIAAALQYIVGKPVIDETGLRASYDLTLDWGDDPVASITPFLRDRFGLELSPAHRDIEVLVVDVAHRDPALLLFGQVGQLARGAPHSIRARISHALSTR
jgi:uncharacterized protein (TIGR03435 family)